MTTPALPWWRDAVIYQIYPRSFADATGEGLGDLLGIAERLRHVQDLGVDAIWLSPFYSSPQRDGGYDISDYCDVDPLFGRLADFDALLKEAHWLGLKVIVDLVPNHSSSEHRWFIEALAAAPGSPERARYIFRDGKGEGGATPPNNWESSFGGPAWTRVIDPDGTPGQWYLHLFDSSQPDFDWSNPWVADRFDEILRFWLDRGVDGFRIDVANGVSKAPGLPDLADNQLHVPDSLAGPDHPHWGRNDVHAIWRRWRDLVESYPGGRALVAEAWVLPLERMALWVRPDELHQAFNFPFLATPWSAWQLRNVIVDSLKAFGDVGAPATWVLSNHDTVRHPTRLALETPIPHAVGIGPASAEWPNEEYALWRGRAATLLMLALPGSAYLFQGEELGLPEVMDLPDDVRQDPLWFRTAEGIYGRDGCRVPLPWEAESPSFGFSATGDTWLPQPESWAKYAANAQRGVEDSTLEMYKLALRVRRSQGLGVATLVWNRSAPDVLDFTVGNVRVIANLSAETLILPDAHVLAASRPLDRTLEEGSDSPLTELPPDTTVWLAEG